ncbi:MAG: hypothetical protein WCC91_26230 [Bradyrhizobium sp.]
MRFPMRVSPKISSRDAALITGRIHCDLRFRTAQANGATCDVCVGTRSRGDHYGSFDANFKLPLCDPGRFGLAEELPFLAVLSSEDFRRSVRPLSGVFHFQIMRSSARMSPHRIPLKSTARDRSAIRLRAR